MSATTFYPARSSAPEVDNDFVVNRDQRYFASGGYGDVYLAFNHLKQPAAVKIIRLDGNIEKAHASFRAEMKAHSLLCNSPFVIRYLGCYVHDRFAGVVMEYAACGNLNEFLHETFVSGSNRRKKITFGVDLRNRIIYEIICGIQYLHNIGTDQRAIHGDLKTSNILLTGELHAKLADFGCTKFQTLTQHQQTNRLPHGEVNVISIRYTAPEVLKHPNRKKRSASDIYSFGVILWEIWSRKKPFSWCQSTSDVKRAILSGAELRTPIAPKTENMRIVQLFLRCYGMEGSRPSATDIVTSYPLKFREVEAMKQTLKTREQMDNVEPTYPKNPESLWKVLDIGQTSPSPSFQLPSPAHQSDGSPPGPSYLGAHQNNQGQLEQMQFFGENFADLAHLSPQQVLRIVKQYIQGRPPTELARRPHHQQQQQSQRKQKRQQQQQMLIEQQHGHMHQQQQPMEQQQHHLQQQNATRRSLFGKKEKPKTVDVKIFIAGENGIGKHWLINRYINGDVLKPTDKRPKKHLNVDGIICNVKLITDLSDLKRGKEIGLVLLCFAIDDSSSFQKLTTWSRNVYKQIRTNEFPRWIVCLREDLRNDSRYRDRIVTEERVISQTYSLNAKASRRCSARTGEGVDDLFLDAIRFATLQKS